jgi:alkylation response protein AidB-like acyl-CoA dehydrogenase
VCDDAIEMATHFARANKRAGKLLVEHQLVQLKLNEMHALTEALRSYVMRTAWERDLAVRRDERARSFYPAMFVANFSKTVIERVTLLNMEVHGATHARINRGAEKLVRDGMIWTHLASDTVQRLRAMHHLVN